MRNAAAAPILVLVLATLFLVHPSAVVSNALNRDSDPVIMTGSQLSTFTGLTPGSIVAFRFDGAWVQIPVQVDERAVNDFGIVYNSTPIGITTLAYTDAGTFMGADPDPLFDDDDELVFMAKDANVQVPPATADPPGVVAGTRIEVTVSDPLTLQSAYVYLFETDGTLTPDAGADYVTYNFVLLSGPYLTTYNTMNGPNPENSEAVTASYRTHFSDRWIRDEANVYAGGATGDDILDRHKNLFSPGNCARSENTFSNGEGAFFVNKDGPVRAIRSYLGANSGPLTQRDHFFYERRHDVRTHLRVHLIGGVTDFYDYSPAATGMTYYNDVNLGGVTIDGSPDVVTQGAIVWEMVTGAQGSLVHASRLVTDIPGFAYTSYYEDDTTPLVTQCTGDAFAYGSSGLWVNQTIPNTDPYLGTHNIFVGERFVFAEPPNQSVAIAQQRYDQAMNPLTTTVTIPTAIAGPAAPAYRLSQNYPNPFTAATHIEFEVPVGADATLRIYDVRGRLVSTLFSGRGAGSPALLTWNGTDAAGRRVSSGIYFYRLESSEVSRTRKMVVVE